MKKYILSFATLLIAFSSLSQNSITKPKPSGFINTRLMVQSKFAGPENEGTARIADRKDVKPFSQSQGKTSAIVNSWENFTASMNIYGMTVSYAKPLQWNDELNAISFVHRKSPSYSISPVPASNAATGGIVAMISTDCGITWDSTAIYANDNFWGRYPNGAIYNPPGTPSNTNINNAYIVGAGPTTGAGATTWIGNWFASKQLGSANYDNVPSTVTDAQQAVPTAGPFPPNLSRHDFAGYNFTATDDGVMRVMAGVTDDGLAADVEAMMVTGTFNNGVFNWEGVSFDPPTVVASDGKENWVSRPMMAWNEQGTVGYVVIVGSRTGATGSNVGIQPIVYKSTNSGQTWTLENGINFNSPAFSGVKRSLATVQTDTTLEVPFFNWIEGMDCAVDANNKLHVFSSILSSFSNDPDSAFFTTSFGAEGYRWPHQPLFQPYLYDFIYDGVATTPGWTFVTVDSMATEGPGDDITDPGYQDNPWDADPQEGNQKVRIDARLQMSRTPDGQYIVYTWADSDTALTNQQKKWNTVPNIKARVMNVSTGLIHPLEIDITTTAPNEIALKAMYHFVSPKCRLSSTITANGPALTLPITVSNSTPYSQLTGNSHWFSWAHLNFGNVPDNKIILCGPLTPVGLNPTSINPHLTANLFPNPAVNNTNISFQLSKNSKARIDLIDMMGQVVRIASLDAFAGSNNIPIELNGLPKGIYMVNVTIDEAVFSKKLMIE